jgi:hypothetical protein
MIDYRRPENRRKVFNDFYDFHLKYRSHPGCVYYLIPYLKRKQNWTEEEAVWFAFINGNTQNPITSWIIFNETREVHGNAAKFVEVERERLAWDTDRRYHRKAFAQAYEGWLAVEGHRPQMWAETAKSWPNMWATARSIPTFGRLSAWSFSEYMNIIGYGTDSTSLMLEDMKGSRSHRNGLAIIAGRNDLDWHQSNPTFNGEYTRQDMAELTHLGTELLKEAKTRNQGKPWETDVTYLTLESSLCTYKSWHRPNRRYANVYNDMLHDRIKNAEQTWPELNFNIFWEARKENLPKRLLLEENPHDPGVHKIKQNHYLKTGQVIMLDIEHEEYENDFTQAVNEGKYGVFR